MAAFKFGIFKIIGLIGILAEELGTAATDGKITLREGITIMMRVAEAIGVDFDTSDVDLEKLGKIE